MQELFDFVVYFFQNHSKDNLADLIIVGIGLVSVLTALGVLAAAREIDDATTTDNGLRGKLERIERLLNEYRTERTRFATETQAELKELRAELKRVKGETPNA